MIRNNVFFLFILLCFSGVQADDLKTKDQMRYQSLIQEVRCLVCQNQSVAESNAELAKDLRREIKLQIQDGKSDSEIKKYLFDRYGEFILYEPAFSQKTFFLWSGNHLGRFVEPSGVSRALSRALPRPKLRSTW